MIIELTPEYNELLPTSLFTPTHKSVPKYINLMPKWIFKVVIKLTLKLGIKLIPKYIKLAPKILFKVAVTLKPT